MVANLRKAAEILLGVALAILGFLHFFFSIANMSFIEDPLENFDVVVEMLGALVAAITLWWAAVKQFRQAPWMKVVLIGAVSFTAGMLVSIASGASTGSMIQVIVPIWLAFLVGMARERRLAERVAPRV